MGSKTNLWIFQTTNSRKTWTCHWKRNLERETDFLQIAAQNNAIWSNYIKVKIDQILQNCKFKLINDSDKENERKKNIRQDKTRWGR